MQSVVSKLTLVQSPALSRRRHSTVHTLGIVAVTLECSWAVEHFRVVQLIQAVTSDGVNHLVDSIGNTSLDSSLQCLFGNGGRDLRRHIQLKVDQFGPEELNSVGDRLIVFVREGSGKTTTALWFTGTHNCSQGSDKCCS